MFKKFLLIACLTLFVSCSLYAIEGTLEVRAAGLYHTSDRFRDIYGDFGASYELEASLNNFLWANVSWSRESGEAKGNSCSSVIRNCSRCRIRSTSKISILSFSFGLRFPYHFSDRLFAYFGLGPVIGNVWLENTDRYNQTERIEQLAYGGIAKLGINHLFTEYVFVDLFVDYLYEVANFDRNVDVGGIKGGMGLGVRF